MRYVTNISLLLTLFLSSCAGMSKSPTAQNAEAAFNQASAKGYLTTDDIKAIANAAGAPYAAANGLIPDWAEMGLAGLGTMIAGYFGIKRAHKNGTQKAVDAAISKAVGATADVAGTGT